MVAPVVTYGWELEHKEGRKPKNWCLLTAMLEKTPESPLNNKEIKPVNLKGDQPWIFTGRTDTEAEAPGFWSSDVNRRLTGKVPDSGKVWGQKKRVSEDEMAGRHHWHNERELGQTPGDGEGQGDPLCCSPRSHKQSHTTGWLNNNNWRRVILCYFSCFTIDKGLFVFYQLSLCTFSLSHFNVPISCTLSYKQNNQLWLDLSKKQIYWKNIRVLTKSKKSG